jgi:hypothetical protein
MDLSNKPSSSRLYTSTINRHLNTPSPVVFPSASPTPKLYSTPTKKLPQVRPWQEIGIESVPQNSENMIYHHDDYSNSQQLQQYNYSNREKPMNQTETRDSITPLSMMLESDTLLDDEDISSYRFSEEDYLSSIISSESSINPARRRPISFTSPSPLQQQRLEEQEPIVGSPFTLDVKNDPIIERRFSIGGLKPDLKPPRPSSKFGSFLSKMKKAASGKQSIFK